MPQTFEKSFTWIKELQKKNRHDYIVYGYIM